VEVEMFELIMDQLPELQRLERAVLTLEREHGEAQSRVAGLSSRVMEAREDDLNREALALNRGRKAPSPKEPELREQLEGAQRELEILERRLALAGSDRSRYIQEHHDELARLLMEAREAEGARVAEGASRVLEDLLVYFKAEDDIAAMRRLIPAPAEENTGAPERSVAVWGSLTRRNITGGPPRGDLEGTLRYLASLGPATVVGEDAEGAA
jgi:hypothetical protein